MKHLFSSALVACLLVGVLSSGVFASDCPNLLNYQGRVNDTSGVPVSDGTHAFEFRIYDAAVGGTSPWGETVNLTTSGGLFNHVLGSVTALPEMLFPDNGALYLETEVDGTTLLPRTQIVSVAYARRVNTVHGSSGGTITGSVRVTDTLFASYLSSNSPLRLQTAGVTRMYVDDVSGNVGIGTISPSEQLELTGNLRLPPSSATVGVIKSGGDRFIHNFGTNNFFAGANAGNLLMSGTENTGVGTNALQLNTTGINNTAIGHKALLSNTVGNFNTASGVNALRDNTDGGYNTATGHNVLLSNTTGDFNTASGNDVLTFNTTGSANTASGYGALSSNTSGSNLTAFGWSANVSVDGLSNASVFGSGATVGASNTMVFGNTSVTGWGFGVNAASGHAIEVGTNSSNGNGAYLTTGGTWTNTSDRDKKESFTPIDGEELLKKIDQLPITMWNYKGEGKNIRHIGPMAQDFSRIFQVGNDDKSISTIDPAGIALAALKELNSQVQELRIARAELEQLKSQLSALSEENARLQQVNALMNEEQSLAAARIARIETTLAKLDSTPFHSLTVAQNEPK